MDSLTELLAQRASFDVPPEAVAIKKYVHVEFDGAEVAVIVREKDIIIAGRSSALIGALRMRSVQLKKAAATDKKLVFRIG